jgi:hypothetical protein
VRILYSAAAVREEFFAEDHWNVIWEGAKNIEAQVRIPANCLINIVYVS